jgi:hypothetical protein
MASAAAETQDGKDIKWVLAGSQNQKSAEQLLQSLSSYLPVYSAGANQIYSNYHLHFTYRQEERTAVALPDTFDHTATISHIPPESIIEASLFLILTKDGLMMAAPLRRKTPNESRRYKVTSITAMLKLLREQRPDLVILPVLQRGSMREYLKKPMLQLSIALPERMDSLSPFDRKMLQNLLSERMIALMKAAPSL